jgi:translocation and assembly module TamA
MLSSPRWGSIRPGRVRLALGTIAPVLLAAALASACATLPKGQYGVVEVDWTGVKEVNPDAIETCLVTRERERTTFRLGLGTGKCGTPPFDSSPPKIEAWTLPWNDWPIWDPAIFEVDKRRIERWYRARGFYDARVLGNRTYVDGEFVPDAADCEDESSDCELEVVVQVDEGQPIHVAEVSIESKLALPPEVLERVTEALTLERGQRFDEHPYEEDKKLIQQLLWNASYARAKVSGRVAVDREKRSARVVYQLDPGPRCVFGEVRVEGADDVPELLIVQAADIPTGKPYNYDRLLDAEQAVFKLGAFSTVQLKPQGEADVVDIVASVRVGRLERWSGGVGVMSGTLKRSYGNVESIPQWDIHLSVAYEHKNVFGGLRRLRIEDRPRFIQLAEFPETTTPYIGNVLTVRFEQPATFERRTMLFFDNTWDVGPDPYEGFFRQELADKLGLERAFWRQRIILRGALGHDLYDIFDKDRPEDASSYRLPYIDQQLVFDLRNNPLRPNRGVYFSLEMQEAFKLGSYGSWNFIRVEPDLRGYVPLMWDFVLAARFALGAMFIQSRGEGLDDTSYKLGPQSYRQRGGGANGNRGFAAGELGAGSKGGIRSYEASLELRIPFGSDFGMVLFGDVGNVTRGKAFHFEQLNAAAGFGLRYFTIIGAIRFDVAWRIPGLQVIGEGEEPDLPDQALFNPAAFHLTIGEAF